MASEQRSRLSKRTRDFDPLTDLGIFDIPNVEMMDDERDRDDDSALELELEAILSGKAPTKHSQPRKKVAPLMDIETMAAECLKDDVDEEDDENLLTDPELLKELQDLSCNDPSEENLSPNDKVIAPLGGLEPESKASREIITVLEERLELYKEALNVAEELNVSSKVHRYARAIKTLEALLKSAKSGRNEFNVEDIPPPVLVPTIKKNAPLGPPEEHSDSDMPPEMLNIPVSASEKSGVNLGNIKLIKEKQPTLYTNEETDDYKKLLLRQNQYKVAALEAKRCGEKTIALKYMKISKTFDSVIKALNSGETVDLSNMPPSPPSIEEIISPASSAKPEKTVEETQTSAAEAAALAASAEPGNPSMFSAPPPPTSILEALEQRLNKFASTKAVAEAEGNCSKARRLNRIVKSYETAIKNYKNNGDVNLDDLPVPPGFAPFPISNEPNTTPHEECSETESTLSIKTPASKMPTKPTESKESKVPKTKIQRTNTSTFDKQLEYLLERQKMFREAALVAKKNGDIQQAKEYLRMSKGFHSMIEASKCGLPIDVSSIPTPPQLETDFVIVDVSECVANKLEGSSSELLNTLKEDLTQQIQVCTRNKEHFLRLGDVSTASKFEKLGLESRKDLSVIYHTIKANGSVPKFHYETRLFSILQCNPKLNDNELEVTVERGINLPGKPNLDSYVKLDFPIPSGEAPQRAKTHTVKDTNNPIFQEEFKFDFNRKSRAQLRLFKRKSLKFEVYSKGGFLRSDNLLGTVSVKLVDLETKCKIHDCFELMDDHKRASPCGGQLEVKILIRDPLLCKQVEEVREKWLVIGS